MMHKNSLLLFAFLFWSNAIFSQGLISGSVKDKTTNETVPGATIKIEGTTIATVSDLDGSFKLKNNSLILPIKWPFFTHQF